MQRAHRDDVAAIVAIVAVLLPLYLATMYPDVLGSGDSAKFQYLGRVLGTAHSPGYPAFVMLTHLYSYVPIGTLAWRMNFFSVLCALAALAASYGAARRLGAGAASAALLAIACGTGLVFWNGSLAAEVYPLNALLVTVAIWRVLAWRDSRRDRDLLTAAAALSIGLGNHLTIATVAPAFVIFALWTDARRSLRGRVVLGVALCVTIGLAQYLYIMVRTWQHAQFVEAHAATLPELFGVMRADRYKSAMFAFSVHDLLTVRAPLLGAELMRELQIPGLLLVGAGFLAGIWRRPKETVLLTLAALGILTLTADVDADIAGFSYAAMPAVWLLGACAPGMQGGRRPIAKLGAAIAAVAILVIVSVVHVRANFKFADHSDRTIERRLWTAVFEAIPNGSEIVAESYPSDQSLLYMLAGEGVQRARGIELVQPDVHALDRAFAAEHRTIVALSGGARSLRGMGLDFKPLPLLDWPIPRLVGASRRDRFVVVAAQPSAIALLRRDAPDFLTRVGGSTPPGGRARYAVAGAPGHTGGDESAADGDVDLDIAEGRRVAGSAWPRATHVHVGAAGIDISIAGETPFHTDAPLAVLLLNDGGRIRSRLVPANDATLRPRLDAVPVFALTTSTACEDVGDRGWHDLAPVLSSHLLIQVDNYRAFDAHAIVYVASAQPLAARVSENTGPQPPRLIAQPLSGDERRRAAAEGLSSADLSTFPYVTRIELQVNDQGDNAATMIDLGAQPSAAWATGVADRVAGPRVRACRQSGS